MKSFMLSVNIVIGKTVIFVILVKSFNFSSKQTKKDCQSHLKCVLGLCIKSFVIMCIKHPDLKCKNLTSLMYLQLVDI